MFLIDQCPIWRDHFRVDIDEYAQYDGTGLRELIDAGQVSVAEVEAAARSALIMANATVNGLAGPLFPRALEHADGGPFRGVPFLIKDVPMAKGIPFTVGSVSLRGIAADHDTDMMGRFRAAGLATLGVSNMPELGLSFATEPVRYGPTSNPWDLRRGVGGSSGGAAALVAAGAVPLAHAVDGAGSIRVPASCCGLVGLKPGRGRTPCGPDAGEAAFGMSYDFALTRTVRDTAHLLDAVHGPGIGDKYTAGRPRRPYTADLTTTPAQLRVAVCSHSWSGSAVDPEVAAATLEIAGLVEQAGHLVADTAPAVDWEAVIHTMLTQAAAAAAPFLLAPHPPDPADLEAMSRQVLAEVKAMTALDLIRGFDAQNRVTRAIADFFTRYDLLITPTLAQLPAEHGTLPYDQPGQTVTNWLRRLFHYTPFTPVFNISGQPAISVPLAASRSGLPIGIQIIAPTGREDLLIQVAAHLEQARPWKDRRPQHHVGTDNLRRAVRPP